MDIIDWLEFLCFCVNFVFAPVHELGHVLFGWLSFNPTCIAGWSQAVSMRDGWMVAFGGIFTNLVFYAGMSEWLGRKYLAVYPWSLSLSAITMMSISFQSDQRGYGPLMPALWYLTGVLCLLFMLIRLTQRYPSALRRARLLQNQKLQRQCVIPRDARAYLDWLNSGS